MPGGPDSDKSVVAYKVFDGIKKAKSNQKDYLGRSKN